jgi:hypothetical protein
MTSARTFVAPLVAAVLTACSSAGSVAPLTPVASQAQAVANGAHPAGEGTLVIKIRLPKGAHARRLGPRYISAATKGMTLDFTGPSPLVETVTLTLANKSCKGTPLTCTIDVALTSGRYKGTVSTFNQAPVHGLIPPGANLLSIARGVSFAIAAGKSTPLRFALDGVPASIAVDGFPNASAGTAFSNQPFSVTVMDADEFIIVGTYSMPVALADDDTSGATAIATEGRDKPPKDVLLSSSDIANISYTGEAIPPVTIAAQAGTVGIAGFFIVRLPVYVADLANNAVKQIPVGCILSSCVTTLGGGFSGPEGTAVNAAGDVFVADTGNNAVKEAPAGCTSMSCVTTLGGGFNAPNGVALDGNGNVYVADASAVVKKIAPGCSSATCVTTLGGGFSVPGEVALDGSGDVFVADEGNGAVKKIPPGCTSASCVLTLAGGFSLPEAVAVDRFGNVFVGDLGTSLVSEIPVGCNAAVCVVSLGGGFSAPFGIAVDGFGNVFVADLVTTAIEEIPPGCASASCVTTLGGGFSSPADATVL